MSLSVIIPIYNRRCQLRDAIDSVLSQRCIDEIIVVDDFSDELSYKDVNQYLPSVRYFRTDENKGVSTARNIGVSLSKSEYIAFLDSDDIYLPLKCNHQYRFMLDNEYKISHTNEFWYRENRFINQNKDMARYGGEIFSKILDKCRVSPSTLMIEKKLFQSANGFDEALRVCEDYELLLRLSIDNIIGYIEDRLTIKRSITDDQLSKSIKYIESVRLNILEDFRRKYLDQLKLEDSIALNLEIERKLNIVKKIF